MGTRWRQLSGRVATLVGAAALIAALLACKATSGATASELMSLPHVTEGHDDGSIGWRITPDGNVHAMVRRADSTLVEKGVSGALLWKGPAGDMPVPMTFEKGALVATGPKLEGDLTEIKYTVNVDGKPWSGALHVPAAGTEQLDKSASLAKAKALPSDAKGPNGGVVQVVGDDTVEVVADKKTGQVRVYVLDSSLKPVAISDRKITLGVVGATPETVVLVPDRGGLYFTGKLVSKVDPVKITVAVSRANKTEVALVSYEPGAVVVVGSRARPVQILVVNDWDVDVKVVGPKRQVIIVDRWHGHGHWGHGH